MEFMEKQKNFNYKHESDENKNNGCYICEKPKRKDFELCDRCAKIIRLSLRPFLWAGTTEDDGDNTKN